MFIVSLAVTSYRLHFLDAIIKNIESQTILPEKVLIYYSHEPWHLDKGIMKIPEIHSKLDIEFICVPNIGSCRKYLFTVQRYNKQNKLLLFIDDDRIWDNTVFEILISAIHYERLGLATTCGWSNFSIMHNENKIPILGTKMVRSHNIKSKEEVLVASSGWATILNPIYIDEKIFNPALQKEFRVYETDEIFLSTMIKCRKYVIPTNTKCYLDLDTNIHQWRNGKSSDAKLKQLQMLSEINGLKWDMKNGYYIPFNR